MTHSRSWHALRLDDPYLPELPDEGSVTVALVAAPASLATGWAARAAAAMARSWAMTGQNTYLCDQALENPQLPTVLGVDNDEGVTDLLLYGVSPRRIAHAVDDGLFLAPAGTITADPGAVRASPRWDALVEAFAGAGALLLLYVPGDAPGVAAVLARADAIVTLGPDGDEVELGEARERLVASLGPEEDEAVAARLPAETPAAVVATSEPASEPATSEPATSELATSGPATPEPATSALPPTSSSADEPLPASGLTLPEQAAPVTEVPPVADPVERSASPESAKPRQGWTRWILMAAALAAVALAVAVAMRWIAIPGVTPGPQVDEPIGAPPPASDETPGEADVPASAPPADPLAAAGAEVTPASELGDEPLQAWSLALEAHRPLDMALTRVDELRARWPDLLFWIAPIEAGGERYHRVLAGPATALDQADALRSRLGGDARWIAREAGLGFVVGEMADLEAARVLSEALLELGVPTHVLRIGTGASTSYRIYAGSYANAAEAEPLRRILEEQDLGSAVLTERRGVPPS